MKMLLPLLVLIMFLVPSEVFSQASRELLKRDALKHMSAGRYGEAINLLNTFIAQQPGSAEGYYLRGVSYEKRSQLKNAVLDFRSAGKLAPQNQEIQKSLQRTEALWKKELVNKISDYKRELAINPKLSALYFAIGEFHAHLDDWNEAESWFAKYFSSGDVSPDQIIQYAEILARTNQLKKGEQFLETHTRRYPQNYELLSRYGYFLLWLGKLDRAEKTFETVLAFNPLHKEALEGLNQIKKQKSEDYAEILRLNPKNTAVRLLFIEKLIKAKRFEEALDQLEVLAQSASDQEKRKSYHPLVMSQRDSVYRVVIADYSRRLRIDPANRGAVMKLTGYYSSLGDYGSSLEVFDNYFDQASGAVDPELRFRYAQHAAWHGAFDKAMSNLDLLLESDSTNLNYQFLAGQIRVWTRQELPQAQIYLENVHRHDPKNVSAVLSLSTLSISQNDFATAGEYLELAKTLEANNKDIQTVQDCYDSALKAEAEKQNYRILEEGRRWAGRGECHKALEKYEEYFAKIAAPGKAVMLEYADLHTCANNLDQALAVYDRLLAQEYDYAVAMRRAKNLLWRGNASQALAEFKQLSLEQPDDFEGRLYSGDAYLWLKDYPKARTIYADLLGKTSDSTQTQMVKARYAYLPIVGFSHAFVQFPRPVSLTPIISRYSDNQNFQISHVGDYVDLGLTRFILGGPSFTKVNINSGASIRGLSLFKFRANMTISEYLAAGGSFGILTTSGGFKRGVSDLQVKYERPEVLSATLYYENTDAALLLYSPHLAEVRYGADLLRLSMFYQHPSAVRVSGYLSHVAVADGNSGNDFQIRIGKQFRDAAFAGGYESQFLSYKYQVPLYYSPLNLGSHSVWLDWNAQNQRNLKVDISGKLGYIAGAGVMLREIRGKVNYQPAKFIVVTGQIAAGSSFRFDSSYNYFSFLLSAYTRLY